MFEVDYQINNIVFYKNLDQIIYNILLYIIRYY